MCALEAQQTLTESRARALLRWQTPERLMSSDFDKVPYGRWTCADGREVLFNRAYWPILERRNGGATKIADCGEWVSYIKQEYFFDDGDAPDRDGKTLDRLNGILAEWGMPPLSRDRISRTADAPVAAASPYAPGPARPRQAPWANANP
jgi:hypothetical protein